MNPIRMLWWFVLLLAASLAMLAPLFLILRRLWRLVSRPKGELMKRIVFVISIAALFTAPALSQTLPPVFISKNVVSVVGHWQDETPNSVNMECTKWTDCIEAQAWIWEGLPVVSLEHFEIVRWDDRGLVAQLESHCLISQIQVNFKDKTVTTTDTLKATATGPECSNGPQQTTRVLIPRHNWWDNLPELKGKR